MQEVELSDNIKDRHLLAEDKSLRGECDLHLTNVDFTDDGRYVCQMSNELGSFEQPVDLHILGTQHTRINAATSPGDLTGGLAIRVNCGNWETTSKAKVRCPNYVKITIFPIFSKK